MTFGKFEKMIGEKMTLKECIEQIEFCDYRSEGGKLECNEAFRQLKHVVERIEEVSVLTDIGSEFNCNSVVDYIINGNEKQ
ncbi:MAG: hypothetical protein WC877_01365 [Dehalococcoidales bacterium]|jgi:hypothetical protein